MYLRTDDIEKGWRARADMGDVNHLVASLVKTGQIHPIVVETGGKNGKYKLIAGARRLAACCQLGWDVAAIEVKPEDKHQSVQLQLEENFARKDFDALEIADGLKQLKEHYQELHPLTKLGGTGGGQNGKGTRTKKDDPAPRFTQYASRSLNCGESRVKDFLQISNNLTKSERDTINKAKSTKERNKLVREAFARMRVENKKKRLERKAAEIEKERQEAIDEGANPVVVRLMDNKQYFDECEPEKFDLIFTDPPYGQRQSLISHAIRGDIDTNFGAWDQLDVGWVLKAAPLLAEGGQMLIFSPLEGIGEYKMVCESSGLKWRGAIIWHKSNPGTAYRNVYLSSVEAICWATKDNYVFQEWSNAGSIEAHNILDGPICAGEERLDHPTQKPLWLLTRFLRRHTNPHSLVLDPFAGVGSVLVACRQLGLPAVGIEKDANYVHQTRIRLQAVPTGHLVTPSETTGPQAANPA